MIFLHYFVNSQLFIKSSPLNIYLFTVIFGPMFSGKTTELIRRLKRYQIANYKCLIIKYANDNRYDKSGIATHDRQTLSAMAAVELSSKKDISRTFDVIGIDEGQFFPDTVEFAEEMADQGKIVIVAALDATFQRVGFGNILNLVPLAECVVKLTAVCMNCYSDASYTKRRGSEKEIEVIGGADKYMAVCRDCYKSPLKNRSHSTEKSPKKIRSPLKEVNENINPLEDTESVVVKRNLFSNEGHVMHEAC